MTDASTHEPLTLVFGYTLPPDATAAWGARLIVTQNGDVDMLGDRVSAAGDKDRIFAQLDSKFPVPEMKAVIRDLLRSERSQIGAGMSTRRNDPWTLYMDRDGLTVIANTSASAGYCYVSAFLQEV